MGGRVKSGPQFYNIRHFSCGNHSLPSGESPPHPALPLPHARPGEKNLHQAMYRDGIAIGGDKRPPPPITRLCPIRFLIRRIFQHEIQQGIELPRQAAVRSGYPVNMAGIRFGKEFYLPTVALERIVCP
jgi:hypothetical protein